VAASLRADAPSAAIAAMPTNVKPRDVFGHSVAARPVSPRSAGGRPVPRRSAGNRSFRPFIGRHNRRYLTVTLNAIVPCVPGPITKVAPPTWATKLVEPPVPPVKTVLAVVSVGAALRPFV